MKKLIIVLAVMAMTFPSIALGATADLAVKAQDIKFSTDTLVSGDEVRVYATVKNVGDIDMSGYAAFYLGSSLIGSSQVVTLVANGENEEAWTDFIVPTGSFNIRVDLKGTDPQDNNSSNDTALSPLYTSIEDQDSDGVEDDDDNCIDISNSSQKDTDSDGKGDACDTDDDNDGLSDDFEKDFGTDPEDADTDNDGVDDARDYYPQDPLRQEQEAVQEVIAEIASDLELISAPIEVIVTEDVAVDQTLLERTSGSRLNISSNAAFIYVRNGWKTYEFEALAIDGTYSALSWNFGDGTSSAQKTISHEFRSYGTYTIALSVVDNDGNILTDSQEIEISFFHLKNPLVQLVVGALFVLLITSALLIARGKNGIKEKKIKISEEFEEDKIAKKIPAKSKVAKKSRKIKDKK